MIEFVTDFADPRLDDYRELKEQRLREDSGKFVAESEIVVRKLLASRLRTRSILLTAPRLAALEDALPADVPVFVLPQAVMDQVAGLHVHRGCLAIGERPPVAEVPVGARTLVVLEDLVDVDNLGALARSAAALGVDALLLSPRCADPFYRKAIRVSAGCVFGLPIVRCAAWPADVLALRSRHGFALVGAALDPGATLLPDFRQPEKLALLLGSEGPGLRAETKQLCDTLVKIPLAADTDSLNVATAGAVLLYALR